MNVLTILKKVGAIVTDSHFVYTSGKHGSVYINKDFLYPHVAETAKVGKLFAEKMKKRDIDIVVAPAVGGTILCTWTAYYLSRLKKREIMSVYTEKDKGTTASAADSEQIFRRGYDTFLKGKKVLIVEDLTTTGISVKKTAKAVQKAGGEVSAICVMVNRNPVHVNTATMGAPFYSLGVFLAHAYDEEECPLCKKNIPVNITIGHGKDFINHSKKQA